MKRFILYVLVVLSITNIAFGSGMDASFNKREQYRNKTVIGNPDEVKFIDRNADISHLGNLNDTSLMDKGKDLLNNSSQGRFLQNAEEKKIDAIERYKINPENAWLKNSLAIEANPMAKTGGKGLSASEQTSTVPIKKTCVEGVDFNVDVGVELVLECEEEEFDGPLQLHQIDIPYIQTPAHWWLQQRLSQGNTNLSGSGGGISNQPYELFLNSPEVLDQLKGLIAGRLNTLADVTVPAQDILYCPLQFTLLKSRNVIFHGGGEKVFGFISFPRQSVSARFHYNTQEKLKKLVEKDEYWQIVTEGAEQLAEANECYETERVCLKSGVKTFFDKYDVIRPCWYEKVSYRCTSEPKGGCDHLVRQSCKLEDSFCEHKVGSICLKWKREYICGGKRKELLYSLADSPIYCLGGDCHKPVIEENQDFANVAYLAALNEAKKDCVKEGSSNGICKDPITVFPGYPDGCKKIIVGLIDCCSSMKGWGKNANLCRCSGEEQGLALKRDKGLCHPVGTYCSHKDPVLGQCLEKKTNFCCFGSKLARVIHEQGRPQLGMSWGSASSPDCRPFTLDELKRLDFSKFDMEALFEALLSKGKSNMNKTFALNFAPGEVPPIQKEHMKVNTHEKREIRRKAAEEEERQRLARLEAERLERERLARLEAERLERERLAMLASSRYAMQGRERELDNIIALKPLLTPGSFNHKMSSGMTSETIERIKKEKEEVTHKYKKLIAENPDSALQLGNEQQLREIILDKRIFQAMELKVKAQDGVSVVDNWGGIGKAAFESYAAPWKNHPERAAILQRQRSLYELQDELNNKINRLIVELGKEQNQLKENIIALKSLLTPGSFSHKMSSGMISETIERIKKEKEEVTHKYKKLIAENPDSALQLGNEQQLREIILDKRIFQAMELKLKAQDGVSVVDNWGGIGKAAFESYAAPWKNHPERAAILQRQRNIYELQDELNNKISRLIVELGKEQNQLKESIRLKEAELRLFK